MINNIYVCVFVQAVTKLKGGGGYTQAVDRRYLIWESARLKNHFMHFMHFIQFYLKKICLADETRSSGYFVFDITRIEMLKGVISEERRWLAHLFQSIDQINN